MVYFLFFLYYISFKFLTLYYNNIIANRVDLDEPDKRILLTTVSTQAAGKEGSFCFFSCNNIIVFYL